MKLFHPRGVKREKIIYIIDTDGKIIESDVSINSITKIELVGSYIDEIVESRNITHFMECVRKTIKDGADFCAYSVEGHKFLAKMVRISSLRIKVIEVDVTGLEYSMQEVFDLF